MQASIKRILFSFQKETIQNSCSFEHRGFLVRKDYNDFQKLTSHRDPVFTHRRKKWSSPSGSLNKLISPLVVKHRKKSNEIPRWIITFSSNVFSFILLPKEVKLFTRGFWYGRKKNHLMWIRRKWGSIIWISLPHMVRVSLLPVRMKSRSRKVGQQCLAAFSIEAIDIFPLKDCRILKGFVRLNYIWPQRDNGLLCPFNHKSWIVITMLRRIRHLVPSDVFTWLAMTCCCCCCC